MHKKTVNKHRTSGSSEQQILRISEFPGSNLGPEIGYPTASSYFIFMLPCIVIDFFLNNQPDALIIQIYSVIKLHVSGIFSAHHQEFSTVHSALLSFMQVFDDRFQAESGWNPVIKLHTFRASSLPVIRSFLLYIRH